MSWKHMAVPALVPSKQFGKMYAVSLKIRQKSINDVNDCKCNDAPSRWGAVLNERGARRSSAAFCADGRHPPGFFGPYTRNRASHFTDGETCSNHRPLPAKQNVSVLLHLKNRTKPLGSSHGLQGKRKALQLWIGEFEPNAPIRSN
jgi:hypothetical protein